MAKLIPEEKIAEITHRANIVEIVSEVVLLKKSGKNFVGLCPFHSEKTPSFSVSPDKQMFYCFGCGEGGGVFQFVQKQGGFSFVEAARMLARRYGVDLPRRQITPAQRKHTRLKEGLFAANKTAAAFYNWRLTQGGGGSKAALYLKQRGLSEDTLSRFQLGYAPQGWERLRAFLSGKGISAANMDAAGLTVPREVGSGTYDRFRNRIMFPIFDLYARVAGFGGRVMDDSLPKYLNTPETAVFNKRKMLYGLCNAREQCRKTSTAYVVEGYFDVLSLFDKGIENAVATLGTAFTMDHLRLLKGFAKHIVLVFDSDAAGVKAALRSSALFLKEGVDAKVMILPKGQDPDSFVRRQGRDAFMEIARRSRGVISFLVDNAVDKHGSSIEGKNNALTELETLSAEINDPVVNSLMAMELSDRTGIDERAIRQRFNRAGSGSRRGRLAGGPGAAARPPSDGDGKPAVGPPQIEGSRMERQIVSMMIHFPAIMAEVEGRGTLEFFDNDKLKAIGRLLVAFYRKGGKPLEHYQDLKSLSKDKDLLRLAKPLFFREEPWNQNGCLILLSQFERRHRCKDNMRLKQKIQAAEGDNNPELVNRLLKEKQKQALKILETSPTYQEV